jgi:putative addiction module component (TIGR02574 family)
MAQQTLRLDVSTLTVSQRLELIGQLWDGIQDETVRAAMPDWHREELDRRIIEADADRESGIPLERVIAKLRIGR